MMYQCEMMEIHHSKVHQRKSSLRFETCTQC